MSEWISVKDRLPEKSGAYKVVIENEAVFIDWAKHLAPDLLTRNETYKPNRDAIKDAIERGEAVPDVHIEQGESLRIK